MNTSPDLHTLGLAIRDTLPVIAGVFLALLLTLGSDLWPVAPQAHTSTPSVQMPMTTDVEEEARTSLSTSVEGAPRAQGRCSMKANNSSPTVSQPYNIPRPKQNAPRPDA